jgi:hypothetical protein
MCYLDSVTFLHVDDVRTSQEAHLWTSRPLNGDSFTFLHVDDVCTSQEKHTCGHPRSVTGMTLLVYRFTMV